MKKIILTLTFLIIAIASFFFSSWTNAMVISRGEIPLGIGTTFKISPLLSGVLIVIMVGVLAKVVSDK
jgi:hypothetical protein